jgi:hypothetical protein
VAATNAYKFYLNMKRSDEILHYYTNCLQLNLDSVVLEGENDEYMYIALPAIAPDIPIIEVNPENVCVKKDQDRYPSEPLTKNVMNANNKYIEKKTSIVKKLQAKQEEDDDLIIIINENGLPSFYKMQLDGTFVEVNYDDKCREAYQVINEGMPKRRKRNKMSWKACSLCPIEYRFVSKLQKHMWAQHGIVLYTCKVRNQIFLKLFTTTVFYKR